MKAKAVDKLLAPKPEKVGVNFRLEKSKYEKLKKFCKRRDVFVHEVIEAAIEDVLSQEKAG